MITNILLKLANIAEELKDSNLHEESELIEDLMESTIKVAETSALFSPGTPFMGSQSDPETAQDIAGMGPAQTAKLGVVVKDVKGAEHTFTSRKQIEQAFASRTVSLDGIIQGILAALKANGMEKSVEYFSLKPYSQQYELLLDVASHYKMLND